MSQYRASEKQRGASIPLAIALAAVIIILGVALFLLIRYITGSKEAQNALDAGVLAAARQSLVEPSVDLSTEAPASARARFQLVAREKRYISLANINRVWTQALLVALNAQRMIESGKASNPVTLAGEARSTYRDALAVSQKLTEKLKTDAGGSLKSTFEKFANANAPLGGTRFESTGYRVAYMDAEDDINIPIGIQVQSTGEFAYQQLLDAKHQDGHEVYKISGDRIFLKGYVPIRVALSGGEPLTFMFVPLSHGKFPRVVAELDFAASVPPATGSSELDKSVPPNAFSFTAQVPIEVEEKGARKLKNTSCAVAKIASASGGPDESVPLPPTGGGFIRVKNLPGVKSGSLQTDEHVLEYTNKVLSMRFQALRYGSLTITGPSAEQQQLINKTAQQIEGAREQLGQTLDNDAVRLGLSVAGSLSGRDLLGTAQTTQAALQNLQSIASPTAGWNDTARTAFARTMLNPVEIPWGTTFGFRLITFLKWLNCVVFDDECNHSVFAGILPKPTDQMVCCYLKYPFLSLSLNGPIHTSSLTPKLTFSYTPVIHQFVEGPEKIEGLITHKSAMDPPGCLRVNGYGTVRQSNARMNSIFYDWQNDKYWPTWLAMLISSLLDAAAYETRGTVSAVAFSQWFFFNWIDRDFLFAYLFHWAFSDINQDVLRTNLAVDPGEGENGYSGMRLIKTPADEASLLTVAAGGPFKEFTEDGSVRSLLFDRRDEREIRPIYDDLLQRLFEIAPAGYNVEEILKNSQDRLALGQDGYIFYDEDSQELKLSTSTNGVPLPDWISKSAAADGQPSQHEYLGRTAADQVKRSYRLVDPKKDWDSQWSSDWSNNYPARVCLKDVFRFTPASGSSSILGELVLAARIEKRCTKNGQLSGPWNEPEDCFCGEETFGKCDAQFGF
ncbi:MAG TPA: hypothetical protein V6D08_04805 [Candidatus Obscuribacterales bacterium]